LKCFSPRKVGSQNKIPERCVQILVTRIVVLVEVVTADECSAAVGTFGRFVIDVERAIMTLKVFLTAEGWRMERGTHIGGKMRLNTRNENCGSG
jgi:hypothetical protein